TSPGEGEGGGTAGADTSESEAQRQTLHLRRWPRRRRPHPGAGGGPERRMLQGPVSTETDGTPASSEGVGEPIPVPPAIRALRARRRRRRKPPEAQTDAQTQAGTAPQTPGDGAETTNSGDTPAVASTTTPADRTAERPPRSRHRRR